MMHELAHRIPESTAARAVGLSLIAAATPLAANAAKHLIEKVTSEIQARRSESPIPQIGSISEYPDSNDKSEVVLPSDSNSRPKVIFDPQALREEGII